MLWRSLMQTIGHADRIDHDGPSTALGKQRCPLQDAELLFLSGAFVSYCISYMLSEVLTFERALRGVPGGYLLVMHEVVAQPIDLRCIDWFPESTCNPPRRPTSR